MKFGPQLPMPAQGPARGAVLLDGTDGASGKYAALLAERNSIRPYAIFDMAYVDAAAEAAYKLRSLVNGRMILRWNASRTWITIDDAAIFGGAQVMTLPSPAKGIYFDWPIPDSFTFITKRMLAGARKTTFEAAASDQIFFWAQYDQANNATLSSMMLQKSTIGARVVFNSVPGDSAEAYWSGTGGALVAGAEPIPDENDMWAVRFNARSLESYLFHNDAETPIGGAVHAEATPMADGNVVYACSFGLANDTNGWQGSWQCDLWFDDRDPRRALSDQQFQDIIGDLDEALEA